MKFRVEQTILAKGLEKVLNVVPQRTTFPILSNILMDASDGKLMLAGTDLDISVSTKIDAEVTEKGGVTVSGKRMGEIIKELPPGEVQMIVKKNKVSVDSGKGSYQLMGMEKDEYPELPEVNKKREMRFDAETLHRSIEKTTFAVSMDEMRPALSGALWQIRSDEMRMVATDGHRLAFLKYSRPADTEETQVNVPPKALNHLDRLVDESKDVEVRFEENRIGFYFGDTVITTRLVEGDFPDYEQVIPKDNDKLVRVERDAFGAAIRRVAIFANPNTHLIRIRLRKGIIELFSSSPDIGEAKEECPCQYDGDDLDVGYNAQYLMGILRRIDSPEVTLAFSTPLSAGLFTPSVQKDGEELLYLLMPVRLMD
jgi:DNA polymerase-3 subunit beta